MLRRNSVPVTVRVFLILVVVVVGALYLIGSAKLNQKYSVATATLAIPTDTASIERGRHFAVAIAKCSDCHNAGLSGKVFLDVPPFRLVAPNLTRGTGGVGGSLSDADIVRAIREGVAPDGHALLVMPSEDFTHLSDADLADIIAYVRSVPPVDNQLPASDVRPLGRIMLGAGLFPPAAAAVIDHSMVHVAAMPPADTIQYGHYMAQVGGCFSCHGAGLSGGAIPGVPPDYPKAQNLTPTGLAQWSDADIVRALRVGKRPDDTTINTVMPWPYTAQMTDTEMAALIKYLRSVPPRATGTR
jgi:mono/diheme cytochrome c family protein